MTYATLDQYNMSSGIGELFVYAQDVVPIYADLLFGVLLMIISISIYFGQESKKGRGDFPVAFAVGSTVTTVLAVVLGMISGFVPFRTLMILISVTIVSYAWLFLSKP